MEYFSEWKRYTSAIEFIKDLPEFMFWWSFSLKKRWILDREIWDIDVIVPASYWIDFKNNWFNKEANTSRYWDIVPDWIFIYTFLFDDWELDVIFRKDYNQLKFDLINWYKHLDILEIKKQKEHLLNNWNWLWESKHKEDLNKINLFLTK